MRAAALALLSPAMAQQAFRLLTLVALAGVAAVFAWMAWSQRQRVTLDLCLAVLLAVLYTNASDLFSRAFGIPSILQPAMLLVIAGVWLARRRLAPAHAIERPLTLCLILYATVVFCSNLWARDLWIADFRIGEAIRGLIVYGLIAAVAASWTSLRRCIAAIVIATAAMAALSAFQLLTGNLSNDYYGFAAVEQGNIYSDVAGTRIAGPVHDPNFYGQMLLVALALAVGLALTTDVPWRRVAFAAAALLTATIAILTYSRGAMLAFGASSLLFLLLMRVRPLHIAYAAAAGVVVLLLLPTSVTARLGTVELLFPGRDPNPVAHDASLDKRRLVLGAALQMFAAHPLLGVGAGNFSANYDRYANLTGSSAPQYDEPGSEQFPHTLYAQIAAETGLAGLTTFAAAVVAAVASLLRSRATFVARGTRDRELLTIGVFVALAAYLMTSLFLHGAFQRFLWILLGFTAAVARLRDRDDDAFAEAAA